MLGCSFTLSRIATQCQIFTSAEITSLRKNGKILRGCLQEVAAHVQPGITTKELDTIAEAYIRDHGGVPGFKGYNGFEGSLCISVNDEIVHGIPGSRVLQEGDIVSLDGGVLLDGLNTDACITVGVGNIAPATQKFLTVVSETLDHVLSKIVCEGMQTGSISAFIELALRREGYSPVRGLTGHGLGTSLHQFPDIPNAGKQGTGPALPLHTLVAIEPIASMGSDTFMQDDDGWTLRTSDGSLACHFEHTVLIEKGGCEVIA